MSFGPQEEAWPTKGPGVNAKEPGSTAISASERAKRGRRYKGDPVYAMWLRYIEPACFRRKDVSTTEQMTVFRANVKHLRGKGLENDDFEELFILFADQIRSGKVDVKNKSAWRVFMGSWWKLDANKPSYVHNEHETEEDRNKY